MNMNIGELLILVFVAGVTLSVVFWNVYIAIATSIVYLILVAWDFYNEDIK